MQHHDGWPDDEDVFIQQCARPDFAAVVVEALLIGTLPGRIEALI